MSSRGDLLSTVFAVGSLAGLFLYKQRTQHQGLTAQATRKAQEDARSDVNWDSFIEGFAKRLLQSQKLSIDWPVIIGDVQGDNEDDRSEDGINSQGIQIYTKTSVIENAFQLPIEKIVCNSSMVNSPLKIVEEQEEKTESEGNGNAQLDSEPASNASPAVNRMVATVHDEELIETPQKATSSTPKTPGPITSTNSSKAERRRTIFGAHVTKKYVRPSNVGVPISSV
mmetsp:Transcript_43446/g.104971  ORF Transcript_43446/g.104971 Transcript_43446/m.104971 type:complete len:226 (-) Transcript_43446:144-821(-)|eukprot:CAMPEP_0113630522 /NCGR_PEP_ID=MMETSP0017_2-20120614/15859_1 /TAXON_ID=2856 /ORGANISM="Cylindrotheca closterium" /LENGTH=225 /DNA_ID=CAMNT_0000540991 /DNA_START=92 /DNA_END=769 /DNA_ORIENTATION=- /assembly_acc=CAM_ASM_000147